MVKIPPELIGTWRRMATVPKCQFDLEVCGVFVDEPSVVDGNLVSGRTFHDNGQYRAMD